METLDHLNVALDDEYMPQASYDDFRKQWSDVRGLLGGYISYLEKLCPKDKKFKPLE